MSELFARYREWRTWDTTCEKVYAPKVLAVDFRNRPFDDIPVGAILTECCASLSVDFNGGGQFEAGCFEPRGLSASARANF